MMSLARAAEWYARQGLHIFPCAPRTKKPLKGSHGHLDAAPDASPWKHRQHCNIAINCIASRLVLVDEDDPGVLVERGWDCPPTWTSYGRRGPGRWYRVPLGKEPAIKGINGRLDIKWRGFGMVPPSIHPITDKPYVWDPEMRPGRLEIAEAPAWLLGPEADDSTDWGEPEGQAADSFLGVAFRDLGWLGPDLGEGRNAVRCPWADEHTDGRGFGEDSSTVIFAPRGGLRVGTFYCAHSHCGQRRTREVIEALPLRALSHAASEYRAELDTVAHILARVNAHG